MLKHRGRRDFGTEQGAIIPVANATMGFFSRLFGRRKESLDSRRSDEMNFAFVLLSEARIPEPKEVVAAFVEFAAEGEEIREAVDGDDDAPSEDIASFVLSTGETVFVALMPIAVPKGEADEAAQFSVSRLSGGEGVRPHQAHLMVAFQATAGAAPTTNLSRFTSVLAAVAKASSAVAVYWGNAGATHDRDFFLDVAGEHGIVPRLMLWSGVSVARERDGRLSLLSLGMRQLGLPDLLLVAGSDSEGSAVETMFDLLAYVAGRNAPVLEGETVGRDSDERLMVRYVRSPIDPKSKVWRVELP